MVSTKSLKKLPDGKSTDDFRNLTQQGKAVNLKGGAQGTDDGGHLFAALFQGPGEQINYVPMERYTNQNGPWKQMETTWKNALAEGKSVEVNVKINYTSSSRRPDSFDIDYSIDGQAVPSFQIDNF